MNETNGQSGAKTPRSFDFGKQLKMSQGNAENATVESVLLAEIPGACAAHEANKQNDKNGTDWWVEHCTSRHLSVDAKVRLDDYALRGEDDLALESWSVVEGNVIGWTRDENKRTDYILWFWVESGRWCLVPFPMLCKVMQIKWTEWSKQFKVSRQLTRRYNGWNTPFGIGYQSECIFVPRREVWAEMYRQFSGDTSDSQREIEIPNDSITFDGQDIAKQILMKQGTLFDANN